MAEKKFKRTTVTSALPYANGGVHIGHLAGVYIPADIYVRYLRLKDYCAWHAVPDSFFEGDEWLDEMERIFLAAKPMMDFMNAVIDDYE